MDVVAGRIRFLAGEGAPPGGRRGSGVGAQWVLLPPHALVLFVHGGLWPGAAGWWAVVLVVLVVVVVVVVCAGGGGASGGDDGAVGMALGSLGVPVGLGGRQRGGASFAALGAVQLGGQWGRVGGWA